jgi:hypothetical protein
VLASPVSAPDAEADEAAEEDEDGTDDEEDEAEFRCGFTRDIHAPIVAASIARGAHTST